MSRSNSRKAGGLNFNPLLARTESLQADSEAVSSVEESTRVDTSTRPQVDPLSATPAAPPSIQGTTKFTFYFTAEQLDRLDQAWETFRRQTRGTGKRISKSQFVRIALDRLLDEFDEQPEKVMAQLRKLSTR